ncbi:MAG: hypothetical protein IJW92_06840, partial [Clostridia bacterium]|nr:hypothetical protein [Clostridia bacterium]
MGKNPWKKLLCVILSMLFLVWNVRAFSISAYSESEEESTVIATPAVSIGGTFTVALDSGGVLYSWGSASEGALGAEGVTDSTVPVAVKLPENTKFTKVSAGHDHVLAVT